MFAVAGQLYDQAPNRQPRKADVIMEKLKDAFRKEAVNDNEFYTMRIEQEDLYKWLHDKLFEIPEFYELNLSQIEYERGISVDDENRARYNIITPCDVYDSESWKSDFIDLDAFVGNVHYRLLQIVDMEEDCFLCMHQDKNGESTLAPGDSDKCKSCCVNPNLRNNYECEREPKGKYTFACKFDCYRNRYICCEECDDKSKCDYSCDASSADCGNAINRK